MTRPRTLLLAALGTVTLLAAAAGDAEAAKRKTTKQQQKQAEQTQVSTEEIGVLRKQDIHVVEKLLYSKAGRTEIGFDLSGLFFDPYVVGVQGGFDLNIHVDEWKAFHAEVIGGYGFSNQHHNDLTNDIFALGPSLGTDARRILAGVSAGIQLAPIYAKFSLAGAKVVHNDVYFYIGASGFLGQGMEPGVGYSPLIGPAVGIGTRLFVNPTTTIRLEFKDHITIEQRAFTERVEPVNNLVFTVGVSSLGKRK